MKNPEQKPLRIIHRSKVIEDMCDSSSSYPIVLGLLAVAEAILWKAGKKSAEQHFIALVKELETQYGFYFDTMEDV